MASKIAISVPLQSTLDAFCSAKKVSPAPMCMMTTRATWADMMGECSKETAFEILDTFYELGGNFIGTANSYHGGQD